MKTLQEIFDTAYLGLAKQGFERSLGPRGCQYRGADNRRCAIGHCIPDEIYNTEMEGRTVESNEIFSVLETSASGDELFRLQQCHDVARSSSAMKYWLKSFAERFGLTIPQIKG